MGGTVVVPAWFVWFVWFVWFAPAVHRGELADSAVELAERETG